MKALRYSAIVALFFVLLASAYRIGIRVTVAANAEQLSDIQAIVAFNHLQRYEELLGCLKREMSQEAILKLEMSVISQKELIAEHLKTHDTERVNKYISTRQPGGAEKLKAYVSNRGNSWREPSCE